MRGNIYNQAQQGEKSASEKQLSASVFIKSSWAPV